MYLKLFYYRFKTYLSNQALFWQLCFPFILGTLFFIAFGSELKDTSQKMNPIPVALVVESETAENEKKAFLELITGLDDILDVKQVSFDQAETLLEQRKIDAIIIVNESISMNVMQSKLNQSVIKSIIDIYLKREEIIRNSMQNNKETLPMVLEEMQSTVSYMREDSFGNVTPNAIIQYFYALVGMACLYCCYYGLTIMNDLQGNLSEIAARRCMAPNRKFLVLLCDLLAAFMICIIGISLLFVYLILILKINFGKHIGLVLLTAYIGCLAGLTLGMIIGSIAKKKLSVKIAICTFATLFLSFLSGLMLHIMPDIIEQYCPIINRINPVTLITNSFYCLTFYDNYDRYLKNMVLLLIYIIVFILGSTWMVRRRKYASL